MSNDMRKILELLKESDEYTKKPQDAGVTYAQFNNDYNDAARQASKQVREEEIEEKVDDDLKIENFVQETLDFLASREKALNKSKADRKAKSDAAPNGKKKIKEYNDDYDTFGIRGGKPGDRLGGGNSSSGGLRGALGDLEDSLDKATVGINNMNQQEKDDMHARDKKRQIAKNNGMPTIGVLMWNRKKGRVAGFAQNGDTDSFVVFWGSVNGTMNSKTFGYVGASSSDPLDTKDKVSASQPYFDLWDRMRAMVLQITNGPPNQRELLSGHGDWERIMDKKAYDWIVKLLLAKGIAKKAAGY